MNFSFGLKFVKKYSTIILNFHAIFIVMFCMSIPLELHIEIIVILRAV